MAKVSKASLARELKRLEFLRKCGEARARQGEDLIRAIIAERGCKYGGSATGETCDCAVCKAEHALIRPVPQSYMAEQRS